jgi:hypothetical protein
MQSIYETNRRCPFLMKRMTAKAQALGNGRISREWKKSSHRRLEDEVDDYFASAGGSGFGALRAKVWVYHSHV